MLEALAAPKYLISSSTFGISAVDPSTAISSRLWNSICRFVYTVFMYFLFKSSNRSLLMCWRCFDGACLVIVWCAFGSWLKKLRSSMDRDFPVFIRKNSAISSKFIFCFVGRENAVFLVYVFSLF